MDSIYSQKKLYPPISKGIVTTFDSFIDDIKHLIILSVLARYNSNKNADVEKALKLFLNITDDSLTDDCFQLIESLKNMKAIETEEYETMKYFEKETATIDFYNYFCMLRNLVEQKLSLPLLNWKLVQKDSATFLHTYGKLSKDVDDIRCKIEKAKLMRNKVMPYQEEKKVEFQKMSASEDFKSLHPHFLIKNSEEHMENISALEEKKIDFLREQQRNAKQNFKNAMLKFRKEIEDIIEETLKTKSFVEWLEEKNHFKLKDYEMRMKEEWNEFKSELERGRELDKIYNKKHALYLQIRKERAEKGRLQKIVTAATTVQAHWRAYVTRKQLKEKIGIA